LHIATRILEVLERRYHDDVVVNQVKKHHQTIKAAALLHDIGHGPFSHLMERAFQSTKDHEERTMEMITSPDSSIPEALVGGGLKPEEVRQVIDHKFPVLFLQDIVSSQLDADRMDYLMRDSHFAGVNYGVFDLEWILNSLCVGTVSNEQRNPEFWRLCLDHKRGLQAAEQLIMARQHMSLQIYYHKSTRRWEAVFLCLIREAARLAHLDLLPKGTPELVIQCLRLRGKVVHADFLLLDEPLMFSAFAIWKKATFAEHRWLSTLASGFLDRKKVLIRAEMPENLPADLETLLRGKLEKEIAEGTSHWELDVGEFIPYKGPSPELKQIDPESYRDAIQASSILLSDGSTASEAQPVSEASRLFETLIGQRFRLRRLFCDPSLKLKIDKAVQDTIKSPQLVLIP